MADHAVYHIINVKTGVHGFAPRAQMRERYGIDSPKVCDLLKGNRKTSKGLRLAAPADEAPAQAA